MTQTFERFLRSFSDDELTAFVQERRRVNPPYWKLMQVALRIEASRRGLALDEELTGRPDGSKPESPPRSVLA
jgi:hypothetical protein